MCLCLAVACRYVCQVLTGWRTPSATYELREEMNKSSTEVPYGEDEFELAGLEKQYGNIVKCPMVKRSPVKVRLAPDKTPYPHVLTAEFSFARSSSASFTRLSASPATRLHHQWMYVLGAMPLKIRAVVRWTFAESSRSCGDRSLSGAWSAFISMSR